MYLEKIRKIKNICEYYFCKGKPNNRQFANTTYIYYLIFNFAVFFFSFHILIKIYNYLFLNKNIKRKKLKNKT